MEQFIDFFLLREPNTVYVVFGSVLIAYSAALTGCFLFLRKEALVGDAIAHSVLPGICIAFLLFHSKHPAVLLIGAILSAWLSIGLLHLIENKTKLKSDTAIGLVLSWFFGIGIMLLTYIQKTGQAGQSGLNKFLFGKASSLVLSDLWVFGGVSLCVILTIIVLYKPLKIIAFDRDFGLGKGLNVGLYEFILATLAVVSVATGIQAVGVVLMAAMLITPAAAARFWTHNLKKMLWLSGFFGAVSGVVGAYISYVAPRMPTGPWIVIIISLIAIFSFLFGTKKGFLVKKRNQLKIKKNILLENILKAFYHLGEETGNFRQAYSVDELLNKRFFSRSNLQRGIQKLLKRGYLHKINSTFIFTPEGHTEGKRITRLHRLWEMYLTEYVKIAPDHVHDDAEAIEHIITPEIEAELVELLNRPEKDPHRVPIPYDKINE